MISRKKFSGLKPITQIFKICNELELQRDNIISGNIADFSDLRKFYEFLPDTDLVNIAEKLFSILNEKNNRSLLEKIHFLFHELRENSGYPISEKQFIKTSSDKATSQAKAKNELIIILENLRSAFNVGSIIRSAECFSIKEIISTGLTPQKTDPKVTKTAKNTEKNVDFSFIDDISIQIKALKDDGYKIIGAETGEGSVSLSDHKFYRKSVIIFGNEEIGLTQKAIGLCDSIVEINMMGLKNSLNVANAASIFMYEYNKQLTRV
ncbi:MAG: hypothetical protein JXR69_06230 [Candidatus Delongbacteria bacterium]|nr:hypothetical protein [Candidatus Delongbacteria bacterium]